MTTKTFSHVLLAEKVGGAFVKVFSYRVRSNGSFPVAQKWVGTLEGGVARKASMWMASQPITPTFIEVEQGSRTFRVSLY